MKRLFLISLVFVLLVVTAVPAMAATSSSNGNGNGTGAGQGNGVGNQDRDQERNQNKNQSEDQEMERERDRERYSNPDTGKYKHQEKNQWKYTPFYLQGVITAVDSGARTITVALNHGNAKVKEFIGSELTLAVPEGAQIFQITQGDGNENGTSSSASGDGEASNRIPITFDQLAVDQKVAIHGRLVEETYTARLITVYIQTPPAD
jgi:hypothetical protein